MGRFLYCRWSASMARSPGRIPGRASTAGTARLRLPPIGSENQASLYSDPNNVDKVENSNNDSANQKQHVSVIDHVRQRSHEIGDPRNRNADFRQHASPVDRVRQETTCYASGVDGRGNTSKSSPNGSKPVASAEPSGERATCLGVPECPFRIANSWREATFHTRTVCNPRGSALRAPPRSSRTARRPCATVIPLHDRGAAGQARIDRPHQERRRLGDGPGGEDHVGRPLPLA
jgi:hypothetical protein